MTTPNLEDRLVAVMDELEVLRREVVDLGHFLGAWHAENGLLQARANVATTLSWIGEANRT